MTNKLLFSLLAITLIFALALFFFWWYWIFCYQWCPYGLSLRVTRKTGEPASKDQFAGPGQQGVQAKLLGPGRYHYLNPYDYTVHKVKNVSVPPGHIRLIKNNVGDDLPPGRFLAEAHEKGTLKRVLTPGVWRINDFGQEVTNPIAATIIKPGYVGVQTLREGENKGILSEVLQAGYYNVNPRELRVDAIEVGYRVWDIAIKYEQTVLRTRHSRNRHINRRIKDGSGVSFPLADGKQMHLDFTVVWGIFPEEAPRIIREYGTVAMVEQKIIEPQVLSICKNAGSNLTTQEFIEGATREKFQRDVTEALQMMGKDKGISFLIALVRGFHPAEDIKMTIQARMLAEEERMTLKIEQERDRIAASLEQAKRMVDVAVKDFDAETKSLVQEELARGQKRAAEIRAQTDRKVAEKDRKVAEIEAQVVRILGQAEADVTEAQHIADAKRFELLVKAFGGAEAFNLVTFAESLPTDLNIEYRYAGPGTFWTDIPKGEKNDKAINDLAAKKILEWSKRKKRTRR